MAWKVLVPPFHPSFYKSGHDQKGHPDDPLDSASLPEAKNREYPWKPISSHLAFLKKAESRQERAEKKKKLAIKRKEADQHPAKPATKGWAALLARFAGMSLQPALEQVAGRKVHESDAPLQQTNKKCAMMCMQPPSSRRG